VRRPVRLTRTRNGASELVSAIFMANTILGANY
jgi:hypothetical protein